MKLTFEDKSYIEICNSNTPNKIMITIVASNKEDLKETIANSVEITKEEFNKLVESIK
jgi:predicted lactoylglutathione lyase